MSCSEMSSGKLHRHSYAPHTCTCSLLLFQQPAHQNVESVFACPLSRRQRLEEGCGQHRRENQRDRNGQQHGRDDGDGKLAVGSRVFTRRLP